MLRIESPEINFGLHLGDRRVENRSDAAAPGKDRDMTRHRDDFESSDFGAASALPPEIQAIFAEAERRLPEGGASGLEEAQRIFAEAVAAYNDRPRPELGDLTPSQVHELIHAGWWAEPFPIRLEANLTLNELASSRMFANARMLLCATIDAGGAPATPAGNLTGPFIASVLDGMRWPEGYLDEIRLVCKRITEQDVWTLHVLRAVCSLAGLIRKRGKKFLATKKASALMADAAAGRLFHLLFHTLFRELNLSYLDGARESRGLQATAPYILYRLSRLPLDRPHAFEELTQTIVPPAVIDEIVGENPRLAYLPEHVLSTRILFPLEELGLLEFHAPPDESRFKRSNAASKTALFDRFFRSGFEPAESTEKS
jgi:hypothetical protein